MTYLAPQASKGRYLVLETDLLHGDFLEMCKESTRSYGEYPTRWLAVLVARIAKIRGGGIFCRHVRDDSGRCVLCFRAEPKWYHLQFYLGA